MRNLSLLSRISQKTINAVFVGLRCQHQVNMNGCSAIIVDSVQDALKQIIAAEGLEAEAKINVTPGSETGDGYASKTYAISVKGKRRTLNLFVKYFPTSNNSQASLVNSLFENETKFYEETYPALLKFQVEKNVADPFNNVPHYYNIKKTRGIKPVVLENIKNKGYSVRERQKETDDDHINMALKTFAKLHAISYAMKDQEAELFAKLSGGFIDIFEMILTESGFDKVLETSINQFIVNLHPVDDKHLLDSSVGLAENLIDFTKNSDNLTDKYSAILQGDCWSNNMMFLYKDNEEKPLDIKLVDWQIIRHNSPVLDLSYFFYTVATKKMLDNLDTYQKIYYNALSEYIHKLGSAADRLYPFTVFKEQWKKYCKFGFAMSFVIIKGMLYEKDEVPDTSKTLEGEQMPADLFSVNIKNQDLYQKRIKDIFKHFLDNNYL